MNILKFIFLTMLVYCSVIAILLSIIGLVLSMSPDTLNPIFSLIFIILTAIGTSFGLAFNSEKISIMIFRFVEKS